MECPGNTFNLPISIHFRKSCYRSYIIHDICTIDNNKLSLLDPIVTHTIVTHTEQKIETSPYDDKVRTDRVLCSL